MSDAQQDRGGATGGFITEQDRIETASVIYLRLCCDGPYDFATERPTKHRNTFTRHTKKLH